MKRTNKVAGQPAAAGKALPAFSIRDVSLAAQRRRIADYLLAHGRATTIEPREIANAMHPAGRIRELRRLGWSIATVWIWANDAQGRPHRCGLYVLQRGKGVSHG